MESANEWLKLIQGAVPLVLVLMKFVVGKVKARRNRNEPLSIVPTVETSGLHDLNQHPDDLHTHSYRCFGDYSGEDSYEWLMIGHNRPVRTPDCGKPRKGHWSPDHTEPRKLVYMQFMYVIGWQVTFFEDDRMTPLPRSFVFQSELKVIDAARRGGADFSPGGRIALQDALRKGRGGVWLRLTGEQYSQLRRAQDALAAA